MWFLGEKVKAETLTLSMQEASFTSPSNWITACTKKISNLYFLNDAGITKQDKKINYVFCKFIVSREAVINSQVIALKQYNHEEI